MWPQTRQPEVRWTAISRLSPPRRIEQGKAPTQAPPRTDKFPYRLGRHIAPMIPASATITPAPVQVV